jgi:uncharacterized protein
MTDEQRVEIIPAGTVVARDIPVGTAVTAADFGVGAERAGPQEVQVGAGGDPLMIGIPIFIVGSLVLGITLINTNPIPLAGMVPVILAATAFFQLVTVVWALLLGQGMVASIFALFSGFWASLSLLLLGLAHNWFVIPAAQVPNEELIYFIAWDVIFFFLMIGMLRLPVVYPAIVALVVAAVTLVIIGVEFPGSATTLFQAAGACVITFCALGVVVFLHISSTSLGGPEFPPLGPPVVK